ncbi:MAG: hypothetical protein AAFY03_10380, partial [Pseudomonadota bacterium]
MDTHGLVTLQPARIGMVGSVGTRPNLMEIGPKHAEKGVIEQLTMPPCGAPPFSRRQAVSKRVARRLLEVTQAVLYGSEHSG